MNIANLTAKMQGRKLTIHQEADALIEFNKLVEYVEKSESKNNLPAINVKTPEEETLTVCKKGEGFEITVVHDQTGSAYGMDLSKSAYDQLRLHFSNLHAINVKDPEILKELEKENSCDICKDKGEYLSTSLESYGFKKCLCNKV